MHVAGQAADEAEHGRLGAAAGAQAAETIATHRPCRGCGLRSSAGMAARQVQHSRHVHVDERGQLASGSSQAGLPPSTSTTTPAAAMAASRSAELTLRRLDGSGHGGAVPHVRLDRAHLR